MNIGESVVFELEDFNPKTGHLHVCGVGGLPCRCVAELYRIAADGASRLAAIERLVVAWQTSMPGDISRHYAAECLRHLLRAPTV